MRSSQLNVSWHLANTYWPMHPADARSRDRDAIWLSLGVRLNRVLFPNLRRPDWNNGCFINRIFPLDSLNLTKVATRPTRAEGPQHTAELSFHPVEELHIVAPSPAPASPLLAHELVMPCQISELAMRTIPGFHTTRVPTILPPRPSLTFPTVPTSYESMSSSTRISLSVLGRTSSLKTSQHLFLRPDAWKFTPPQTHTPNLNDMTLNYAEASNENECHGLLDVRSTRVWTKMYFLSIPRIILTR